MLKMETGSEIYSKNVYDCFMNKITRAINSITTNKTSNAKNKHVKEWIAIGLSSSAHRKYAFSFKVKKHPKNGNLHSYYIKYKNIFTSFID